MNKGEERAQLDPAKLKGALLAACDLYDKVRKPGAKGTHRIESVRRLLEMASRDDPAEMVLLTLAVLDSSSSVLKKLVARSLIFSGAFHTADVLERQMAHHSVSDAHDINIMSGFLKDYLQKDRQWRREDFRRYLKDAITVIDKVPQAGALEVEQLALPVESRSAYHFEGEGGSNVIQELDMKDYSDVELVSASEEEETEEAEVEPLPMDEGEAEQYAQEARSQTTNERLLNALEISVVTYLASQKFRGLPKAEAEKRGLFARSGNEGYQRAKKIQYSVEYLREIFNQTSSDQQPKLATKINFLMTTILMSHAKKLKTRVVHAVLASGAVDLAQISEKVQGHQGDKKGSREDADLGALAEYFTSQPQFEPDWGEIGRDDFLEQLDDPAKEIGEQELKELFEGPEQLAPDAF